MYLIAAKNTIRLDSSLVTLITKINKANNKTTKTAKQHIYNEKNWKPTKNLTNSNINDGRVDEKAEDRL
jgi:hypothetical protein